MKLDELCYLGCLPGQVLGRAKGTELGDRRAEQGRKLRGIDLGEVGVQLLLFSLGLSSRDVRAQHPVQVGVLGRQANAHPFEFKGGDRGEGGGA